MLMCRLPECSFTLQILTRAVYKQLISASYSMDGITVYIV